MWAKKSRWRDEQFFNKTGSVPKGAVLPKRPARSYSVSSGLKYDTSLRNNSPMLRAKKIRQRKNAGGLGMGREVRTDLCSRSLAEIDAFPKAGNERTDSRGTALTGWMEPITVSLFASVGGMTLPPAKMFFLKNVSRRKSDDVVARFPGLISAGQSRRASCLVFARAPTHPAQPPLLR